MGGRCRASTPVSIPTPTISRRPLPSTISIRSTPDDDASILFADIAGFTERASEIPPTELVRFLDRLYTTFDRLVDRHDLDKIKTTGVSYMVVSGVPTPRPDHTQAIAELALDMS